MRQTVAKPESQPLSLALHTDKHMSRRALVVLIFIVILGAAARFITLSRESVDGDELFSRSIALLPIHSGLDVVRNDLVHPPFYYLLLKAGTTVWGASILGIRLWSLVFGVATLPLIMAVGRTLPGVRHAGVLAAAMLAVNEYHIFYSQQARSYAFYTFLVMLHFLGFRHYQRRRAKSAIGRRIFAYGATSIHALCGSLIRFRGDCRNSGLQCAAKDKDFRDACLSNRSDGVCTMDHHTRWSLPSEARSG